MSDELKPCPFCGVSSTEIASIPDGPFTVYYVQCLCECGAEGPVLFDPKSAVKLWNLRPIEDALTAQRDELARQRNSLVSAGAALLAELEDIDPGECDHDAGICVEGWHYVIEQMQEAIARVKIGDAIANVKGK